ncbi:uncharacterized protein LOC142358020 isoform X2 [Convolutriloba macropyga]|uniref:uncharacterized protein LOC142358020 isoform X2 n=1 Tax=Convolutriloba macropyga TaxID=536237 RepID=UPI003F51CB25
MDLMCIVKMMGGKHRSKQRGGGHSSSSVTSLSEFGDVIQWKSLLCTLLLYTTLIAVTYCSIVSYVERHLIVNSKSSTFADFNSDDVTNHDDDDYNGGSSLDPQIRENEEQKDDVDIKTYKRSSIRAEPDYASPYLHDGGGGVDYSSDKPRSTANQSNCSAFTSYTSAVCLCLAYMLYVCESYCCPMRRALRDKVGLSKCLGLLRQYSESYPIIWWRAICYHYARRSKQVSSYRNGERVMMTQDYLERLDTHTALSAFDFSSFTVDDVTRLPPHFNSKPITILRLYKSFGFSSVEAENEYLAQRASFLTESESKDHYIETCEGMHLSDVEFVRELTVLGDIKERDNDADRGRFTRSLRSGRPWYISHTLYWIMTLLGFSWLFRLFLATKTVHCDVTIEKIFCKISPDGNQRQNPRDSTGQSTSRSRSNNTSTTTQGSESGRASCDSRTGLYMNGHVVSTGNDAFGSEYENCLIQSSQGGTLLQNWANEFNLAVELPPAYSEALMWHPTDKGTLERKGRPIHVNKSTQISRDHSFIATDSNSITALNQQHQQIAQKLRPAMQRYSTPASHQNSNPIQCEQTKTNKISIPKSESLRNFGKVLRSSTSLVNFTARGRIVNSQSFGHVVDSVDNRTTYCVHFDRERCLINIANNPLPKSYKPNSLFKYQCDTVTTNEITTAAAAIEECEADHSSSNCSIGQQEKRQILSPNCNAGYNNGINSALASDLHSVKLCDNQTRNTIVGEARLPMNNAIQDEEQNVMPKSKSLSFPFTSKT